MTKMLEDLAEVVRPGTMIPYTKGHFEQQKHRALRFITDYHATITDMAKRLEAAERDAARWRYLVSENNKGMHGKYRICWLDPRRDGFLTTDGVSCDGKDEQAIIRIIDASMQESGEWTEGVG